jgi:large subunit ribosomal protein L10
MPATLKFEQVDELRERLSKAQAVFFSEYKGMTVGKITALRANVRQAGGEMKVAKNTLFKIAMKKAGMASLPKKPSSDRTSIRSLTAILSPSRKC